MTKIIKGLKSRLGDSLLCLGFALKRNNYVHQQLNFVRQKLSDKDVIHYYVREILEGDDVGNKNLRTEETMNLRAELAKIKGVREAYIFSFEIEIRKYPSFSWKELTPQIDRTLLAALSLV